MPIDESHLNRRPNEEEEGGIDQKPPGTTSRESSCACSRSSLQCASGDWSKQRNYLFVCSVLSRRLLTVRLSSVRFGSVRLDESKLLSAGQSSRPLRAFNKSFGSTGDSHGALKSRRRRRFAWTSPSESRLPETATKLANLRWETPQLTKTHTHTPEEQVGRI